MGTVCKAIYNCSKYNGDRVSCITSSKCIYNDWNKKCSVFYNDCSLYSSKETCLQDYRCIPVVEWSFFGGIAGTTCYTIDKNCTGINRATCFAYEALSDECFWYTTQTICKPIFNNCTKNGKEGCNRSKHCAWDGIRCTTISNYRKECSENFDDKEYSGTHSIACDGMSCVHWEYVYRYISTEGIPTSKEDIKKLPELRFQYDSIKGAANHCREYKFYYHGFFGAWCYTNTKSVSISFTMSPCCVPLCDNNEDIRSKCKFTERGRYEYAGNQNVTCNNQPYVAFPNYFLNEEKIVPLDSPLDDINGNSLKNCISSEYKISRKWHEGSEFQNILEEFQCFDINTCRNPTLQNMGDFCFAKEYENFLVMVPYKIRMQSCCTSKCEEGDIVPCTWTSTGKEYSSRIAVTREGQNV